MNYEKMSSILNEVGLRFTAMECKREKGKWRFRCTIDAVDALVHYEVDSLTHQYKDIEHLIENGSNHNAVIKKLFNRVVSNELILRMRGNNDIYRINWNGSKLIKTLK